MTRIVGWNVYKGGRHDGIDRIDALLAVLGSLDADVVVLSEITAATHPEWAAGLRSIGLLHQASTVADVTPEEKYALVITSRGELVEVARPIGCPDPRRVLTVELGQLTVTGIHPPWNLEGGGGTLYTWLRSAVAPMLATPAVIVGDFNADPDEPVAEHAQLGPHLADLLADGWRHALREADPAGDHASVFWDVGARALDHCLLAPVATLHLDSARILDRSPLAPMPDHDLGVADGALSDHRPIVVEVSVS